MKITDIFVRFFSVNFLRKKLFPVILLLISGSVFISCAQSKYSDSFQAMNTFMTVSLYADSAKSGKGACLAVKTEIERLENIFSTTIPESQVYRLNHSGGSSEVGEEPLFGSESSVEIKNLSSDFIKLYDFSKLMYEKTGGALNPALYPLIREWGFTTGLYKVPSEQRIAELLGKTDFSAVNLSGAEGAKLPAGMALDFGALGKGYAADRAVEILGGLGIKSALLDFGGNIQALGTKADGTLWKVGVRNPFEEGVAAALSIENKAVVTSGGYERFFDDQDGNRYLHIFAPKTGRPCQSDLESVTIVCPSGTYADALSTSLFVMGKDGALAFWKENPDFDFILITKKGEMLYSEGLKSSIEIMADFKNSECTGNSF